MITCESCRYCQIRYVKSIQDNSYRCKLMKYKPILCDVFNEAPEWCPADKKAK